MTAAARISHQHHAIARRASDHNIGAYKSHAALRRHSGFDLRTQAERAHSRHDVTAMPAWRNGGLPDRLIE